jgi:thiamine-monophosphate kinase
MNFWNRHLRLPTGLPHLSWTLLWILTAACGERNPIWPVLPDKLQNSGNNLQPGGRFSSAFTVSSPCGFMLGLTMKKAMGELALIERIRSGWGGRGQDRVRSVALGIGDDCAVLRPPKGHEILVTTDFSLEGRHFRRDWNPAEAVGHRALARGLSDLAAMGARPVAAFLSLALPGQMLASRSGRLWVEQFFAGLRGLAEEHRVPLAGGDTSESPCGLVLADIVLVGSAAVGRSLRRSGGRAGDALYVTGELGGAAAELVAMEQRGAGKPRISRVSRTSGISGSHPQLYPEPRVAVGLELVRRKLATAAIDLSDGLSTDLTHLCRESGVGAEILESALPIHPLARDAPGAPARVIELALHGGEDYELLFAAPAAVQMPRSVAGVRVTRIGRLVRGAAISIVKPSGRSQRLEPRGWEHFAGKGN